MKRFDGAFIEVLIPLFDVLEFVVWRVLFFEEVEIPGFSGELGLSYFDTLVRVIECFE